MSLDRVTHRLLRDFRARPRLRAGSLITTVFGDAIAPRGGVAWLGSLIRLVEPFGISERLVRTSVFRLAGDGWLTSSQVGRRSYYALTPEGRDRFRQATQRIYGDPARDWDGTWCLLLLAALDAGDREPVRREAGWLGFAAMSPNVLAHPAPAEPDLDAMLRRLGITDDVVVMHGQAVRGDAALRRLAQAAWNLDDLDARYARFIVRFRPVLRAVEDVAEIAPRNAFLLRSLLVHDYRRILLRDPHLPGELLPAGWHGGAAYQLARSIYRAVFASAERYLDAAVETAGGALPPADATTFARFGGLPAGSTTEAP